MRKLIAGFATSIDGFIEGPYGEIDWIIWDKEQMKELEQHWKRMDAMFYGRKTYETVVKMSSGTSKDQPNPFAHMKHYVFSKSLSDVEKGFILIDGSLKHEVEKIKNQTGKDIAVFGGAELVCSLINLELVDELALVICPVLLGRGKAFFPSLDKRSDWTVKEVKSFSSGLISLTYLKK